MSFERWERLVKERLEQKQNTPPHEKGTPPTGSETKGTENNAEERILAATKNGKG